MSICDKKNENLIYFTKKTAQNKNKQSSFAILLDCFLIICDFYQCVTQERLIRPQ